MDEDKVQVKLCDDFCYLNKIGSLPSSITLFSTNILFQPALLCFSFQPNKILTVQMKYQQASLFKLKKLWGKLFSKFDLNH